MQSTTVAAFSAAPAPLRQQQRRVRVAAPAAAAPRAAQRAASCQQQQPAGQQQAAEQQQRHGGLSRRSLLALPAAAAAAAALAGAGPARAFVQPPPGYRYHQDKLDGYSFFFPEDWQPVTVGLGLVEGRPGAGPCLLRRRNTPQGERSRPAAAALARTWPAPAHPPTSRPAATTCFTATPSTWRKTCL